MHPRNLHQGSYNMEALAKAIPDLESKLIKKEKGDLTLDFSDSESVRLLNQALLKYHYKVAYWNIPDGYLCPPIPSRSDYIHYIADHISEEEVLRGRKVTLLDIGTGANVIYPLVAHRLYGWKCIATDIDPIAIKCAKGIIDVNELKKAIDIRLQPNKNHFFQNILKEKEYITIVVCNPPFYSSEEESSEENQRKNKGLHASEKVDHNFGGAPGELWTEGGELQFIKGLIAKSLLFARSLKWISTLVSKKEHINKLTPILEGHSIEYTVIPMQHGNKSTHILIWKVA